MFPALSVAVQVAVLSPIVLVLIPVTVVVAVPRLSVAVQVPVTSSPFFGVVSDKLKLKPLGAVLSTQNNAVTVSLTNPTVSVALMYIV